MFACSVKIYCMIGIGGIIVRRHGWWPPVYFSEDHVQVTWEHKGLGDFCEFQAALMVA